MGPLSMGASPTTGIRVMDPIKVDPCPVPVLPTLKLPELLDYQESGQNWKTMLTQASDL